MLRHALVTSFVLLMLIVLMVAGCQKAEPYVEDPEIENEIGEESYSTENEKEVEVVENLGSRFYDPQAIQVGDVINGFTVTEVTLGADGTERFVFQGTFAMTGVLGSNSIDSTGPNRYSIRFTREVFFNTLPIATTWDLDVTDDIGFFLHPAEKVEESIGEERVELINRRSWPPAEFEVEARFHGFTYVNEPSAEFKHFNILLLDEIEWIKNFYDERYENFESGDQVTIYVYDEPSTKREPIWLRGQAEGGLVEIVVKGEIANFEHIQLAVNHAGDLEEADVIHRIERVTDQTIYIQTALPCGMPMEKIKWQSLSGTGYEWDINDRADAWESGDKTVTINVQAEPSPWEYYPIWLRGQAEGGLVEIVVTGEILNFEHVKLDSNQEAGVIHRIERVIDQTIYIQTALPCGMPMEKIKWQSLSGTRYEWDINFVTDFLNWNLQ